MLTFLPVLATVVLATAAWGSDERFVGPPAPGPDPAIISGKLVEQPLVTAKITPLKGQVPGLTGGVGARGSCPAALVTHSGANFAGGALLLQQGFVEQEIAAASYTIGAAEFPITVTAMEMIFGQEAGNQVTTTWWTVMVWEGTPDTGTLVASFSSDDVILPHIVFQPSAEEQAVNVQVTVDPGDPEQIFVSDNGSHTFTVGFRIDQHHQPATVSCNLGLTPPECCPPGNPEGWNNAFPTVDTDGVSAAAQNWLNCRSGCGPVACPAGWHDNNFIGMAGDWNIRATYTPFSCVGIGACCLPGGVCQSLTQTDCTNQGGLDWQDGVGCTPNPCPQEGACCDDVTATCSDGVFEADCTGRWVENALCAELGNPNIHPVQCGNGACCGDPAVFPPDGCAENVDAAVCTAFAGVFHLGAACSEVNDCLDVGACCFAPTGCSDPLTEWECQVVGGVQWQGPGTDCATTICFPAGACCYPEGTCSDGVPEEDCLAAGGAFQGDSVLCSGVQCPQPEGACCLANGSCLPLQESSCIGVPGAIWAGAFTDCTDADTNGTADICEAATPTVVNFYSCAVQCSAGDPQQLPNCPDDPVHRYCLGLYDPPAGGGRGAGDPREDTRIEPRFFTSSIVFDLDLSGPPSGAVTVSADCTDGNVYQAGSVSVSTDGMTLTAEFAPPLPNTHCCTLTATGGATGSQDIRLLTGDVNGSSRVNATDKNFVKGQIGDPPLPPDLFTFDLNLSGRINSTDKNIVKGKINTASLLDPSCPCTAAGGACIADAYCCQGLNCDLGGTDTCLIP